VNICQRGWILLKSSSNNAENYLWNVREVLLSAPNSPNTYLYPTTSRNYGVSLTVSNLHGSDTYSSSILINLNPPPIASGKLNSINLILPDAITFFENTSTNSATFFWNFGDGFSSTVEQPWHEYLTEGAYTVQLIASNEFCENDTLEFIVTVGMSGLSEYQSGFISICPNPASDILTLVFDQNIG
jgi:PKD repeat protein